MAKEGYRTITIGKQSLKTLEKYYKEEVSKSMYDISFAEFIIKHAIRDIESERGRSD